MIAAAVGFGKYRVVALASFRYPSPDRQKRGRGGCFGVIGKRDLFVIAMVATMAPPLVTAGELTTTSTNNYGVPGGLIDMPTAEMAPDGQISVTVSHFQGYTKNTATFQLAPWLTGSFRYIGIRDLTPAFKIFYDRSFDLRFRLYKESDYLPAVAVGLRDFLGTGILSAEYVAATKQFGNRLRVTGGIGWGRLGSRNSFGSLGHRDPFTFTGVGTGGNFNINRWFRGPMALFGGLSYDLTDKVALSAEYSSDNYDLERKQGVFSPGTALNFALTYKANDNLDLRLFALNGEKIGANVTIAFNPRNPPVPSGEPAPLPVAVRDPASIRDLGWTLEPRTQQQAVSSLATLLEHERVTLQGLRIEERAAHIRILNDVYTSDAQALGRTVRVLSRTLPASIETFHITLSSKTDLPVSTVTFRRSDVERLENAPARDMLARAHFTDSLRFGNLPKPLPGLRPQFNWRVGPIVRTYAFDPDQPFRADIRGQARGDWQLGSGWVLSGATSVKLFGTINKAKRRSNSVMPRVRSNALLYNRQQGPTLDLLTLAKYARLGPDLYGRVTAGYLETMFAGVSGEVLWKPVKSRLALGAEVNFVRPRDFEQGFGLASRRTLGGVIPEWNGHFSAYYDFPGDYEAEVHAGRYLAGDWGATLQVTRAFANGWKVGAFATKTNVSSATFGEGSFDKGIFFEIPLSWLVGLQTQQKFGQTIRPIQRDGGQRLNVEDRLYEVIRNGQRPKVAESWGRFWR